MLAQESHRLRSFFPMQSIDYYLCLWGNLSISLYELTDSLPGYSGLLWAANAVICGHSSVPKLCVYALLYCSLH